MIAFKEIGMPRKTSPAKSPAQPPQRAADELSEKQLDQVAGGLIYNDKPYLPPKRP